MMPRWRSIFVLRRDDSAAECGMLLGGKTELLDRDRGETMKGKTNVIQSTHAVLLNHGQFSQHGKPVPEDADF